MRTATHEQVIATRGGMAPRGGRRSRTTAPRSWRDGQLCGRLLVLVEDPPRGLDVPWVLQTHRWHSWVDNGVLGPVPDDETGTEFVAALYMRGREEDGDIQRVEDRFDPREASCVAAGDVAAGGVVDATGFSDAHGAVATAWTRRIIVRQVSIGLGMPSPMPCLRIDGIPSLHATDDIRSRARQRVRLSVCVRLGGYRGRMPLAEEEAA